jgi:CubicO group peptidase (beta-lactamase class C family)
MVAPIRAAPALFSAVEAARAFSNRRRTFNAEDLIFLQLRCQQSHRLSEISTTPSTITRRRHPVRIVVRTADGTLPPTSIGAYGHGCAFGTYGWVDPKKDLVGVFLVQQPDVPTERSALMAMAASAIAE